MNNICIVRILVLYLVICYRHVWLPDGICHVFVCISTRIFFHLGMFFPLSIQDLFGRNLMGKDMKNLGIQKI